MAARKPPQRKPRALPDAESNQRDVGILRTGRQIDTLRRTERVKHRRENGRVEAIDAADREAGLMVWHCVTRPEAAFPLASASPRRSGWRGRPDPPRAPPSRTPGR